MSPLIMIQWMIYAADDAYSPYYAGLNIILLGMGLLTPWAYLQNLLVSVFVLVMYVVVSFAMKTPQPISSTINNTTFLVITAVIVVFGSLASARQRFREFGLRWELDKNRRIIEESNRKLVELGQVKDRFFANISHELRTPLTLLLSPLETMIHQRGASFDSETKSLFGIMHANGMRLLKLINDLLDLVRLESGRMEVKREPMEMLTFIRGIASAAQQMAENKGIKLEISVEPNFGPVLADRDKLEKVVLNLCFNALKFTPKGGRVELRVAKKENDFILTVTDTGIGIAQKDLPFVFDRFWQADGSSKRKFQGVGIGLSLVKELTEIHGGKVSVESEEGNGTTFTVRIPYLPADSTPQTEPLQIETAPMPVSSAAPKELPSSQSEEWLTNLYRRAEFFPVGSVQDVAPAEISRNGGNPKLLIADDEPDMLRFLKSQLKNKFQIIETADGQQAFDKALENIPDLILVDMNMPEKDGLQVCRELREQSTTRNIPIIMLTARGDEQTKLSALSAGANDFLTKPFSTTELHMRIKNLLDAHDYQEKLEQKNKLLEQTIEQLKQTEMKLVQTEKMASLGRMSAGIIHEINNPLNYASTGLYTLRNKGKQLSPEQAAQFAEVLGDVEEGINRVKNIVLDLRKFTHPDTGHVDTFEVAPIVNSAMRFLSSEWREKVKIEIYLPEHLTVCANQNRLLQVLINLLQNA
ncbi:MAG: ATP-binding protein, partial [Verrucomicrobiota bacterium]